MSLATLTLEKQAPQVSARSDLSFRALCAGIDSLNIKGAKFIEFAGLFGTGNYTHHGVEIDLSSYFPNEAYPLGWAVALYPAADSEKFLIGKLERKANTTNKFMLRIYTESTEELVEPADDTFVISSYIFAHIFFGD